MTIKDHIGKPASVEEIKTFETRLGSVLPDDYKCFLASENGGRPDFAFRTFAFQKEDGSLSDSLVNWFNGLNESEDYSIEGNLELFEGRIPEGMLPIATDPFGNLILLGVRDPSVSGIWFWDHEYEPTSIKNIGIYKIANSFEHFVETLGPV